jgi:hypothetical protein
MVSSTNNDRLQSSGVSWGVPAPSPQLRPVSTPWSSLVWGCKSETHLLLLLGDPVLPHHQRHKHFAVRNWITKMDLTSTTQYSECGPRKYILYVKQWGLFLLASDWSFPMVHSLQHFSSHCDPRSLRGEGCHDQIPDSYYSPQQAWPPLWSLPSQAWGFIAVKTNLLMTFQSGNCFFHLQIRPAACKGNSTLIVQGDSTWSHRKSYSRATTLPIRVPWLTHSLQPLTSSHAFPDAHGFTSTMIICINQCKQTTPNANFFGGEGCTGACT